MRTNRIVIIDVNNTQNEYSNALQLIEFFEASGELNLIQKNAARINNILTTVQVKTGVAQGGIAPKYYEMSFRDNVADYAEAAMGEIQECISLDVCDDFMKCLKGIGSRENLRYHIRIHMAHEGNSEDMVNLQWLVLSIQRLSRILNEGSGKLRLSVFLVPTSGKKYPYLDPDGRFSEKLYIDASHYLRLVSSEYNGLDNM